MQEVIRDILPREADEHLLRIARTGHQVLVGNIDKGNASFSSYELASFVL